MSYYDISNKCKTCDFMHSLIDIACARSFRALLDTDSTYTLLYSYPISQWHSRMLYNALTFITFMHLQA